MVSLEETVDLTASYAVSRVANRHLRTVRVLSNGEIVHKSGRKKTVCTSAVLAHFGIFPHSYRYCQNRKDMERILRSKGWSVRSRLSKIGKGTSIGQARAKVAKLNEPGHYYVSVPGHAILLDAKGRTVIDTAPRKRDCRKVLGITRISHQI